MDQFVERITTAALQQDTAELKRIIHHLVVIGACDQVKAREILVGQ